MKSNVDYAELLANWDVDAEQRRADFIDYLYKLYERKSGLYSGLWQQFCQDLAESARDSLTEDPEFFNLVEHKIDTLIEERRIVDSISV